MRIPFYKYQGTGNDFLIFESSYLDKIKKYTPLLCERRRGIGADGVLFPLKEKKYDFRMIYYNSDGSEAEFCGNGSRCLIFYMYKKTKKKKFRFIAKDGEHSGKIIDTKKGIVEVSLRYPEFKGIFKIKEFCNKPFYLINSGVPHLIEEVSSLEKIDVIKKGRFLRFHKFFKPEGVNVNFVKKEKGKIYIRTYERGVETETLSCGTGAVAVAFYFKIKNKKNKFEIITKGGERLTVEFKKTNSFLIGTVKEVFKGEVNL
jgi:diaminopimelate epimerase